MKVLIKKILPYILLLTIVVGFLGFLGGTKNAEAVECTTPNNPPECTPKMGECTITTYHEGGSTRDIVKEPEAQCLARNTKGGNGKDPVDATWEYKPNSTALTGVPSKRGENALDQSMIDNDMMCTVDNLIPGCIVRGAYFVFYQGGAWVLTVSAKFFNFLAKITLDGRLYKTSAFISTAWKVVRDISNIFFILVLLYIAVKTILGLEHGVKKMISQVIIMALLINFSMFFTSVIIDSSNILALIFYNKIAVTGIKESKGIIPGDPEKDIGGAMASAFNPTGFITADTFKPGIIDINGKSVPQDKPNGPFYFGVILVAGAVFILAAYAFFTAGISFLGRMIELWILIIASPFAFMSSTLPQLSHTEEVGWDKWLERLLTVSFMAPIFMFFIYLIVLTVKAPVFKEYQTQDAGDSYTKRIILMIIPAMVYMVLLIKAAGYAKKGAGVVGQMTVSGLKVAAGVALGGAALGAGALALAGRGASRKLAGYSRETDAMNYGKAKHEWQMKDKSTRGTLDAHMAAAGFANASWKTRLGGNINAAQLTSGKIDHGTHEIDEMKKKLGIDVSDRRISGVEEEALEKTYIKENRGQIEKEIRDGHDAKGNRIVDPTTGETLQSESEYKADNREKLRKTLNLGHGDADNKKLEDALNAQFNEILRNVAGQVGKERFDHARQESKERVTMRDRVMSKTTGGSYDIRNIASLKSSKSDNIGVKASIGLITAVAAGMRLGLKKTTGNEFGSLKEILTNALKNIKIDLGAGGHGGGDHGGGHDKPTAAHAPDNHGGGHH